MPNEPVTTPDSGITPPAPLVGGDTEGQAAVDVMKDAQTATEDEKPLVEGEKAKPEGEEEKPEPRAPEEYAEFTKPEGLEFDDTNMAEFKAFAKEQDLTQEQAQKFLEFGGEKIKAMTEAPYKLWAETQAKWQAEVKADPEIGGTKFQDSRAMAAKVFEPGESNPFVRSEEEAKGLKEALNMTGAGNNPAMVKFFVRLGSLLSEPGGLTGKPSNSDRQANLLNTMYPTMTGSGQGT
jgi:hypothetical protein